jgi:hypothetical protein
MYIWTELNPWSRVLLEKLTVTQLFKEFPAFYGTVFVTARYWNPSWVTWIQWNLFWVTWIQSTTSHPLSIICSLILSSHLHLGLTSSPFPSGFLAKICMHFSSLQCVLHAPTILSYLTDHTDNCADCAFVMIVGFHNRKFLDQLSMCQLLKKIRLSRN